MERAVTTLKRALTELRDIKFSVVLSALQAHLKVLLATLTVINAEGLSFP